MATSPQTTSPQTTSSPSKNAGPDEQPDDARPRPNGQRGDDAAARVVEPVRDAAAHSIEAVGGIVGQSQDRALRSAQLWTEMMSRLNPFALLTPSVRAAGSRDGDPRAGEPARVAAAQLPVRAWADGVFDLIETALAAQRRTVDQVLATQRELVGQLLDTGAAAAPAAPARERTSPGTGRR